MRYFAWQERIKKFVETPFTEKELRGLSQAEKDFIRENNYMRLYRQKSDFKHMDKILLFIAVDRTTGRKHLYGQAKWQVVSPNTKDTCYMQGALNHACWLLPQLYGGCDFFSPGCYEIRINMPSWSIYG